MIATRGKAAAADRDSKRRTEELTGVFESIRWQNPEGTFIIATLQSGQSIKGNAKPASFIRGCEYVFSGRWDAGNGKYGPTFHFQRYTARPPVTRESVIAYLERHISGIGAKIGTVGIGKLITEFGAENVIQVMKTRPKDVASFLGLTYEQADIAAKALLSIEKFESTRIGLTQLFEGRHFPQTTIEACIDTFGVNAVDAIKRDPFTMLVRGFHGCGFLRVNALYEALGLPLARLKRQVICLWYLLTEGNGSVWYDAEWCAGELGRMISTDVNFKKAVRLGVRAKWLSVHKDPETRRVWLAANEHAVVESELANSLTELVNG